MKFRYLPITMFMVLFFICTNANSQNNIDLQNQLIGTWKLSDYHLLNSDQSDQVNIVAENISGLIAKGVTYQFTENNNVIKSTNKNASYKFKLIDNKIQIESIGDGSSSNKDEIFEYHFEGNKLIFIYSINETTKVSITTIKI